MTRQRDRQTSFGRAPDPAAFAASSAARIVLRPFRSMQRYISRNASLFERSGPTLAIARLTPSGRSFLPSPRFDGTALRAFARPLGIVAMAAFLPASRSADVTGAGGSFLSDSLQDDADSAITAMTATAPFLMLPSPLMSTTW